MSGIWQMQRRALECATHGQELNLQVGPQQVLQLEDGRTLFPLGVSQGIGTCSDIHGINILVLGVEEPTDGRNRDYVFSEKCSRVALLRDVTPEERAQLTNPSHAWAMTERLELVRQGEEIVVFMRPGVTKPYVHII